MSWDIRIVNERGETVCLDRRHNISGGTMAVGGTKEAWLNITYNYSRYFTRLGGKGIRTIYGMDVKASIPLLQAVADSLKDDVDLDYWKATEGNARRALLGLIELATLAPSGKWDGD